MKFKKTAMSILSCIAFSTIAMNANADDWYPAPVYQWDPAFNSEVKRSKQAYTPITDQAEKKWHICVSIPHLKDAYWLAVNYGLAKQAESVGVRLTIYEAGGYENQDVQITQIEKCLADGMDALIVSAITADGANAVLSKVHENNIPIVDLINGMSFKDLSARAAADYFDNSFAIGQYLVEQHKDDQNELTVLWFPGPKNAAWAQRGDEGFNAALKGTNLKILTTKYGDTGKKTQGDLVTEALNEHPDVDYIVGTTVTAEAATSIVRKRRIKDRTKVAAYYFGPGVQRGLRRGSIIAAPSDLQGITARISVDQAVRILENKPLLKHVGPIVQMVDRSNLASFDLTTSLAPRGFKAIFDVN